MPNVSGGLSFTRSLSVFSPCLTLSHSLCLQSHFPFPAPFSVLFWLQLSFDLASGADSNCAASIAVSLHPPPPLPLGFPLPAQSVAHKRNSFTDFLLKAFFELSWLGHLNLQCPAAFPPSLFSLLFNCHFYQQLFSFHFPSLPFSLFRCGGCHILFIVVVVVVGQTMTTYSWPEKRNILFWATSSCRNKRRHI